MSEVWFCREEEDKDVALELMRWSVQQRNSLLDIWAHNFHYDATFEPWPQSHRVDPDATTSIV